MLLRYLSPQYRKMEEDLRKANERVLALETRKKNFVRGFLENILNEPSEWFDYNELSPGELEKYHKSAQRILSEPVFQNELNFLKSNWGKKAILELTDKSDYEIVQHVRCLSYMIYGIQSLKTRFEEIHGPQEPMKKPGDPFSAI